MSNEEKKAIETIKDFKNLKWYEHAFDNGTEVLDEEQKEKKAYIDGTNVAHELCNKMWKDKIKEKIEAIKTNKLRYFHIAPENWAINILQSLLEKE